MTLHQATAEQQAASFHDLLRALLMAALVVAAMLALTALFGVQETGPTYDIVADPAQLSGLPF
jgi:ABC-type transporter Mla subunit MlaD